MAQIEKRLTEKTLKKRKMKNVIIIRPKSREEWLKLRSCGIGSSEVATVAGVNPYETPYQLWRRKKGLDAPKAETFAMKAGHYLEDAVARFWADETGRKVIQRSAGDWLIRRADKPIFQVSPDRTYWLGESKSEGRGILECKTTQKTVDRDDLPSTWFCQVQYLLGTAGLERGSLAWLTAGREFGYADLRLVPDFYGWLCEEVERFWTDYIEGDGVPPLSSTNDVLAHFAGSSPGKAVQATEEIVAAVQSLHDVKGELADLEARRDALEEAIKLYMQDAEELWCNGETLATWKSGKASRKFDAKAFCAANAEEAAKWMVEQKGSRRFVLK